MSTLTEEVSNIPSGALALMAWGKANQRAYGEPDAVPIYFLKSRKEACGAGSSQTYIGGANQYYYAIIDCIAYGHQWQAEKEFNSCRRCHDVKANRDFRPGEFHSGR